MGIVSKIKGLLNKTLESKVEEQYKVRSLSSYEVNSFISECVGAYQGVPYWTSKDVKTIGFARVICSEIARLSTMNIDVKVDGSARAEWIQSILDEEKHQWRQRVELGCAYGSIVLKPNENGIDLITPDRYFVLGSRGDIITDIVFVDQIYNAERKLWFTRFERHKIGDEYVITNRVYAGASQTDLQREVAIEVTDWNGIAQETIVENVDRPLFAMFSTPSANHINPASPVGLPIFGDAIEELKDLDVAYSRNAKEIFNSKRTVMLDSDRLLVGGRVSGVNKERLVEEAGLPDYIKLVEGDGVTDVYKEINPTLNTDVRLKGINSLMSQIGFKSGFSNGYFVFNEKSGMITATQVESDDRRTLQLIADVRTQLERCINDLVYALNVLADVYKWSPRGEVEVTFDFEDLTLNVEEDKQRWYSYVQQGFVPFWRYLVMWEGMTEEEAKEIARFDNPMLFPEDE